MKRIIGKVKGFFESQKEKEERNKKVITKEACMVLFFIIVIIIYNAALTVSKIIPYEEYNSIEFLALVFLNPAVLIALGFVYSFNYGFSWFLPSILSAAFLLSIICFLSPSFAFYIPIYFVFVLAAELCGVSIIKVKKD